MLENMLGYRRLLTSLCALPFILCSSEKQKPADGDRVNAAEPGFGGTYDLLAAAAALASETGTPLNTQLSLHGGDARRLLTSGIC